MHTFRKHAERRPALLDSGLVSVCQSQPSPDSLMSGDQRDAVMAALSRNQNQENLAGTYTMSEGFK